jgi:hypothetical protein
MSALPPKTDIHRRELAYGLCQRQASLVLIDHFVRARLGDYSREDAKGCNAFSAKRCSGATNKAEAISTECNPLAWNGFFAALLLGVLQAT